MLEFLKEQLAKVEEELKQLFIDRARAGVGVVGDIEIRIDKLKKERTQLLKDISDADTNTPPTPPPSIKNNSIKDEIQNLVQKNKIIEAIEKLATISNSTELIMLKTRFNKINREQNMGVLSSSEYTIEYNKIVYGLLNILNDL